MESLSPEVQGLQTFYKILNGDESKFPTNRDSKYNRYCKNFLFIQLKLSTYVSRAWKLIWKAKWCLEEIYGKQSITGSIAQ